MEGHHPPSLPGLVPTHQGQVTSLSDNLVAALLHESQEPSVCEYDTVWELWLRS